MRAAGEGHRHRGRLRLEQLSRLAQVSVARRLEVVAQRDGLAVVVEHHRHLERRVAGFAADPGRNRERQAEEAVRAVDLPVEQRVAGGRPRGLLLERDVEVALGEVAELFRHHQRGAVREGNEPELHLPHGLLLADS